GLAPAAAAPWEKVTPLIDVYKKTEGIVQVFQPVVHEGVIYLAALRTQTQAPRYSLLLLRLTAEGDRKEGQPIELAVRRPAEGRKSAVVIRGTAACIHQERYYLGTDADGIFGFPLDLGAPERI